MTFREVHIDVSTNDPENPIPEILFFVAIGATGGYLLGSCRNPEKRRSYTFLGAFVGLLASAFFT
uniref:p12-12p n=1 Tax=Pyrococcus sp. 12/1 TaxID=758582 RepID=D6MY18_9EURY|nr:hypothetical protein [Pyrococcus sp. 12/1]ADF80219.1 p12-12p [Pyrococcus sp. 12/1]